MKGDGGERETERERSVPQTILNDVPSINELYGSINGHFEEEHPGE